MYVELHKELSNLFPEWLHGCALPSAICVHSSGSTALSTFVVVRLLRLSRSRGIQLAQLEEHVQRL